MNTPIIRPSLIYLINLCDNFKTALFIVMLATGFVVVVGLYEYLNEEEERRYFNKWFKILIIALISSLAMNIALPSEKTCYTMLVSSQLTPQNIQSVGNDLKSAVDYIFQKIDELEEKNENKIN